MPTNPDRKAKSLVGKERENVTNHEWLPTHEEIGKRFMAARGKRKVPEIVVLSGIADAIVRRCEKGEQTPNLELLSFYFKHDGISANWILYGSEPKVSVEGLRIQAQGLTHDQRVALAASLLAPATPDDAP